MALKLSKICCPDPRLLEEVGDLAPAYFSAIQSIDFSKKQRFLDKAALISGEV